MAASAPGLSGRGLSYTGTSDGRRRSRFFEQPMRDYTPADSIYEEDMSESANAGGCSRLLSRVLNGYLHATVCVLLLAIMTEFLARRKGHWHRYATYVPAICLAVHEKVLIAWADILLRDAVRRH